MYGVDKIEAPGQALHSGQVSWTAGAFGSFEDSRGVFYRSAETTSSRYTRDWDGGAANEKKGSRVTNPHNEEENER